jgi:hypothetical protein
MLKWVLTLAVGVALLSMAGPALRRHGLGRLPGDVRLRIRGRALYLPFTSTLLLSAALTLLGRLL